MDKVITVIANGASGANGMALCPVEGLTSSVNMKMPGRHWLGYATQTCDVCKRVKQWRIERNLMNNGSVSWVRLTELADHLGFTVVDTTAPSETEIETALVEIQKWIS